MSNFDDGVCADCGTILRSRVAGFKIGGCPNCKSGRIVREANAPELPTETDLSIAIDNKAEIDEHRKRTVIGVDTGRVDAERVIALEWRRRRAERCALWGGAISGYAALVIELWRWAS